MVTSNSRHVSAVPVPLTDDELTKLVRCLKAIAGPAAQVTDSPDGYLVNYRKALLLDKTGQVESDCEPRYGILKM